MKKHIFNLAILLLVVHLNCSAQQIKRELLIADYLYNHYAFNEAIEHYEKISHEVNDPVTLAKLGDCYRLTKNLEKAANWYKEAYKQAGCPDYVKLHYAQTLMTLGQYKDALPIFQDYQKSNIHDRRIANMITSCEKEGQIVPDMPDGTIFMQKFNTDGLEFGPAIRKGQLVFTTDTVLNGTADKTDKWTGSSFYQMYKVDCEENGHCDHEIKKVSDKINTKYHDGPCSFTQDGSKMFFTRTNHKTQLLTAGPVADHNDVVHLQIMIASDYDPDKQDYKKIKRFHFNSHTHSTAHPAISDDGKWLVYVSDGPGGEGGTDLYITSFDCKDKWCKPKNLGNILNTEGDEMFPYLDGDSVLYFASNGHVGLGGLDIYKSKWDKATNTFSAPVNMGKPVNSPYDDMSFVNRDNLNAYFASNRPAKKDGDNIYSFHKTSVFLALKVIDGVTGKPIASSVVMLKSQHDERQLSADEKGTISTQLHPDNDYLATINKAGYDPGRLEFSTMNTLGTTMVEKIVKLNPNTRIKYNVVVMDERTKKPISNPQLVFIENETMKTDTLNLRTGEVYTTSLQPNRTYHVYSLKTNYYGNERYVSTKNIKTAISTTSIYDTIFMTPLEVGGIYKIDNIYYDYDKATIRENAKPALERLIEILNQYPDMHIQLNSHTDCRGKDTYNFKLSNDRAHSVVMYLMEKGIALERLQYRGYGESLPVSQCGCETCSEEQHQSNRRTEFQITSLNAYVEIPTK